MTPTEARAQIVEAALRGMELGWRWLEGMQILVEVTLS